MGAIKHLWPWLCAILSGLLITLCFPPFEQSWLAWLALTPLISAVWFSDRAKKRPKLYFFLLGYLAGLAYFSSIFFWITTVSVVGWIALPFYLAIYPGLWTLFVGLYATPLQKPDREKPIWLSSLNNLRVTALAGAAWVAMEWLRSTLFTGFGWNPLGVSMHANIPLIQLASITGVGGLSFFLVMMNGIIVATIKRIRMEIGQISLRPHYDFSLTVALVVLIFGLGFRHMLKKEESFPLNVVAVQGNIPKNFHWDNAFEQRILDTYSRLTELALLRQPDLLIWPEAATPRSIFTDERNSAVVKSITAKFDGDFLLGTLYYDGTGDYNSVALLTRKGEEAQLYHKTHLVPFGEYLPFRNSFPIFTPIAGDLIPSDFTAGSEPVVFEMEKKPVRIGPLICFEDTIGEVARQPVRHGAQLLITVTNDGWFPNTAEARQHLANAVFRCAETGLPMVRSSNTGVTCIIDRFGRVMTPLQEEHEGLLFETADIPVKPTLTFYTRYGEIFSVSCLALSILTVVFVIGRAKLKKIATPA
ncbi:MAG: apolipoprotein N-acyltransferase [Chthoniobacterales bacterium]